MFRICTWNGAKTVATMGAFWSDGWVLAQRMALVVITCEQPSEPVGLIYAAISLARDSICSGTDALARASAAIPVHQSDACSRAGLYCGPLKGEPALGTRGELPSCAVFTTTITTTTAAGAALSTLSPAPVRRRSFFPFTAPISDRLECTFTPPGDFRRIRRLSVHTVLCST